MRLGTRTFRHPLKGTRHALGHGATLRRGHVRSPAATAASPSRVVLEPARPNVAEPPAPADAALRAWIENHGGFVLSSLRLVDNAPCGCRGIITTAPLSIDAARTTRLIVVPERLYMTTDDARQLLQPLAAKRFSLSFWDKELPAPVQLAVLLATERSRGDDSFWSPYISSLPDSIPCAWALSQQELGHALAALGPQVTHGWEAAVAAARCGVRQRAEAAVQRYGRHLPGGLQVEDVVWAMGQVLSRSFGRDPDVALAPFIDLCNHRHGAPHPDGFVDERHGTPCAFAYVESAAFGEPRALAAGDEVYVSYAAAGGDPLGAFLNLGFVPPELLPVEAASR